MHPYFAAAFRHPVAWMLAVSLAPGQVGGAPISTVSPETYLNTLANAELARHEYGACHARGEPAARCWEACGRALEHYSQALRESSHADIRPLQLGRALAQTCKADLEQRESLGCLPGAPSSPHAVCTFFYVDFNLARRRDDPSLVPARLEWWEAFARADEASSTAHHEIAADSFDQAYERCERSSYHGTQHCLPLVREALHSRRLGYGGVSSRKGIEASLRLVERALKADDRTCQQTNNPTVTETCALQQDLLLLHGEALYSDGQYRGAADEYERAYGSCIQRGDPPPECWNSYGRPAWRARQKLLVAAKAADAEQKSRAVVFLRRFVTDMGARCDDPSQPRSVADVCHDLHQLESQPPDEPATEQKQAPVFLAAALPDDLLDSALSTCKPGPAIATCWPTLRATTLDRTEAIRSATDPAVRTRLLDVGNRDLAGFVRQANVDCTKIDASPSARACGLIQELAHLRGQTAVQGPPAGSATPTNTAEDRPAPSRRPLLIAGASSVTIGALSFAVAGIGMSLGRRATTDGQDAHADSPTTSASALRSTTWFDRGENANKLVVASIVIGVPTLVAGIVMLSIDAVRRRDGRRVHATLGGLQVAF